MQIQRTAQRMNYQTIQRKLTVHNEKIKHITEKLCAFMQWLCDFKWTLNALHKTLSDLAIQLSNITE